MSTHAPMNHTRWFRRLLKLLPADFRSDYATDMEHTFRAQQHEARQEQGSIGLVRLWIDTVGDLFRTARREHVDQLATDVKYAVRNMRRRPAATGAAVATLAIGIGAVTAILSVVNGVIWRPLGYPDPDRVVFAQEVFKDEPIRTTGYSTFADWRERSHAFSALAAIGSTETTLAGDGAAERVNGLRVTPEFFEAIGLQPALGRGFLPAENRWTNRRYVILSAGLWRRRFGGDSSIVGRTVLLGGRPHVVTGVMPERVEDLIADRLFGPTDVWLPLAYDASQPFACRTCRHLRVVGRLAPGVSIEQAQQDLDALTRQLAREHPTAYAGAGARISRVADVLLGPVRRPMYLLLSAVGVLFLIAGVNVANLLLVRAVERGPEIATRRALGVAAGRLVRQLLTESLVLAAVGALCGAMCAALALRGFDLIAPTTLPRVARIAIDARVLAITSGLAAAAGLLFGMLPAWHLASVDVASYLRGGRSLASTGGRAGRMLVAGNVALAVILLCVTALLGRSMLKLIDVQPGFEPRGLTTASISLAGPAYADPSASLAFYSRLLQRVARTNDVAALTSQLPTDPIDSAGFHIEGRPFANPEEAPDADRFAVTADYFRALRIPLVRGRAFSDRDTATTTRVAIINQTAAAQLFRGEDPIGRRISLGPPSDPPRLIVGIVGDVRHRGLAEPITFQAYVPMTQFDDWPMWLVLRSSDPYAQVAGRVRAAVAELDPRQVAHAIRPFEAVLGERLAERRFLLWLIGAFAGAALLLAMIGLYGVVSYIVAQRSHDIGLRLALGATSVQIRALVLHLGMGPVVAGIVAGLAAVTVVTRPIQSLLFGVERLDLTALSAAVVLLLVSAVAACAGPARRAVRLDPVAALRAE